MEKIKGIFSGDAEENSLTSNTKIEDGCWKNSSLSWTTRIKAFAICFLLGAICSILSSILFWIDVNIIVFAVLYSLGNIFSISSTIFLMGPVSQIKKMFAKTRLIATIIMLLALILTIFFAIWATINDRGRGLVLLFIVIQFFAMLWYSLSYIPYARDAVKKIATSLIGD